MANSVRYNCIAGLKTRLEVIDGTGSYNNTVQKVTTDVASAVHIIERPLIIIHPLREEYPEPYYSGVLPRQLFCGLECWIEVAPGDNTAQKVSLWLSDVERAINGDTSLGSNAIDTTLVSNETYSSEEALPAVGVLVEVEISYRTAFDDPDSNPI
jgi:hypothetical protein